MGEMCIRDSLQGDTEVFTVDMVRKMREGVDGWGNTNWYDKVYGTGVRQQMCIRDRFYRHT